MDVYEKEKFFETITDYFQIIFTSSNSDCSEIVSRVIQPSISQAANDRLISIHHEKTPGPNGFSASFFQSNWITVQPAITKEIKNFFTIGILPRSINDTHIRLIPKILGPKKMVDYIPIALCSVYYKIISKIFSLRLKPILEEAIFENQSVFIPGREISDNVLITMRFYTI